MSANVVVPSGVSGHCLSVEQPRSSEQALWGCSFQLDVLGCVAETGSADLMKSILILTFVVVVASLGACPSVSRQRDNVDQDSDESTVGPPAEEARSNQRRSPQSSKRVFAPQVTTRMGRQGFYTSDAGELRQQLEGFLSNAEASGALEGRDLLGFLSPHAGYRYSGPTAATAYRQLQGREYNTVVLMALSHHRRAEHVAVLDYDAYRTPLGDVEIDRELVQQLVRESDGDIVVDELPFRGEHSLEIQLPFLQLVLGDAIQIAPIILATRSEEDSLELARLLHRLLGQRRDVLFIASSDLSHHYQYEEAQRLDRGILELVTGLDITRYRERGPLLRQMPCGYFPLLTLMELASLYDADQRATTLLQYQNSGDTAGDRSRVVGYGAVAFSLDSGVREETAAAEIPPGPATALARRFSEDDRRELLELARRSVAAAVRGERYTPPAPDDGIQAERGAAFVTLRCETNSQGRCVGAGQGLRGCIGHIVARIPLYRCVNEVARSAAIEDRRFPNLTEAELEHVSYEISVLTPAEPVEDATTVVVGRDGLIMQRDAHRGLLLPQVPIEWGWDRDTFLARTCRKARMESTCWRDTRTRIERFGAVVWGEDLVAHDHY